ncbi:MAG: single-stranded-DNA-specific exonuclease RecJ [Magnetococcales bacterium]|nr:single-stranded-DNA-specific exonuclease RecJ [Magnetococcales bacterium]
MICQTKKSVTERIWQPRVTDPALRQSELIQQMGLHPALVPVLAHRQLDSAQAVLDFLQPRLSHLDDPNMLLGMDRAVERVIIALEQRQPMAVFGDYDVDGATSSALLVRYFRALDVDVRVYIPDRLVEGYGPNATAMKRLASDGIKLVITVDCGIASFEALDVAAEAGMDVIVTDHHQLLDGCLPRAIAVINPNRPDDPFPHKELAGVGVAFYLAMAINRALRHRGWFDATNFPEPDLKQLLDLVAVGTISDVARLTGVNRILVASGLNMARQSKNIGLQALMQIAGISNSGPDLHLTPTQVGFQLGPRINAGGRLGVGLLGSELLFTEDGQRAEAIARQLDQSNRDRQEIEKKILQQALDMIETERMTEQWLGLVVASAEWHPGVVGIVASRLVERFHRPAVVIALDLASGEGKGSGRSVPGVNLLAAIEATSDHLLHFGGHRAAAGLSLRCDQLKAFAERFDQAIRQQNSADLFRPTLIVDGLLPLAYTDHTLAAQLQQLQPFGPGNPEPVFVIESVQVHHVQVIKGRHIRCQLIDHKGCRLDAISFSAVPGPVGETLLARNVTLDIAGTLGLNRYRQQDRLQLTIRDVRMA